MLKYRETYEIMDPAVVGISKSALVLGKHSGRHAFARACAEQGKQIEGDELDRAFRRFKERADAGGGVTLEDVFQEVTA
jgi:2-isopropylmalate synthase